MANYTAPPGPPPPKVPEGWKAVWNAQYSEWFYVNLHTKKSQWEKPTEPIYPSSEAPSNSPLPSYTPEPDARLQTPNDKTALGSNNPYSSSIGGQSPKPDTSEDERLARRLQEEEDALANGGRRGAASDFYAQGSTPQPNQYVGPATQGAVQYPQSQSPYEGSAAQDKGKRGFLGKLMGSSSRLRPQHGNHSGQQGYYPPQQIYGRPQRKPGMGVGGAAALGVGGGLLGGAMLGSALADHGGDTYIENNDYGGDGGDYGDGGGDFGGDFGGGDFGGGDFGGGF